MDEYKQDESYVVFPDRTIWNTRSPLIAEMIAAELNRLLSERDAALAVVAQCKAALEESVVMMRGARAIVPKTDIIDTVIAQAQAAITSKCETNSPSTPGPRARTAQRQPQ